MLNKPGNPQNRLRASLDNDSLAPQLLPISVVRRLGLVPQILMNRTGRVGKDWIEGGAG